MFTIYQLVRDFATIRSIKPVRLFWGVRNDPIVTMRLDSETFKIVWGFQKLTLPSGNLWQFAVQMAH